MPLIIDFNTRVFPRWLEGADSLRATGRTWYKPISQTLHKIHPMLRNIPRELRSGLDILATLIPLPSLLFESTPEDLVAVLEKTEVSRAVVFPFPPKATNQWVFEQSTVHSSLVPAWTHSPAHPVTPEELTQFQARGGKVFISNGKLEPELAEQASALDLTIVLGSSHLVPTQSDPRIHEEMILAHPNVNFVLASMNYYETSLAFDFAEKLPNLYLETSWQPTEIIAESVRRLGAERIIFGSGWPLIGHNIGVSIKRVRDCVDSGFITQTDSEKILGQNAARLLGLQL